MGLFLAVGCGDDNGDSAGGSDSSSTAATESTTVTASASMSGSESATESTTASGSESNSATGTGPGTITSTGTSTASTTSGDETDGTDGTESGVVTEGTTDPTTEGTTVATGDSEGTGTTEGTSEGMTEGTEGTEGTTDGTTEGMSTGEADVGKWLVSFEDTSSPTRLYKIDIEDGHSTFLCALDTNDNYNTSTFGRNGLLYAANSNTKNLEVIDPCTCERTIVGPTQVSALPGITADQGLGLYGLETNIDQLVDINTQNGNATPIGPLGINWGTGGLTWSDELNDTYAINGTDDSLYQIDHVTGEASFIAKADYNFGSVGIEWHPTTTRLYACSNSAELFSVDEKDASVVTIGPMNLENQSAHCDNLAAPWTPVQCVEDVK